MRWTVLLALLLPAAAIAGESYIGAQRCKSCHEFEFAMWSQGPHAKAHLSLGEEQLKDPKCNSCHTMSQTQLDATALLGVQCERCHGGGKYYHPSYVMKDRELARAVGLIDPTAAVCQQCHTDAAPSIKAFDFASMWAKIDHGEAARRRWEKARAEPQASAAAKP